MSSTSRIVALALLATIALASLWVRLRLIEDSLPYASHGDEKIWADRALTILQTGDLNPHRFTKPGAHVYFMTAGFALGYVRAAANLDAKELRELGDEVCVIYPVPSAAQVAKNLYALVSVVAMLVAAFLARELARNEAALVLSALFAAVSPAYLLFSWSYMNTDILGAFAIVSTVAYPFLRRSDVSTQRQAAILGMLSGLTLATKYNLFLIFLSPLAYFALYHRDRWLSHGLLVVGTALVTFFVCTPYALLDVPAFLSDVGREAYHYAYGHFDKSKHTFEPGWEMFQKYASALIDSFGGPVLLVAGIGIGRFSWRDPRAALVVFSFPFALLVYMSSQSTFFARNILSLHLFTAIGATLGTLELLELFTRRIGALAAFEHRPEGARWAARAGLGALLLLMLPWPALGDAYRLEREPRNAATRWLIENTKPWQVILHDYRLGLDTTPLTEAGLKVVEYRAQLDADPTERLRARYGGALILYPRFNRKKHEALFDDVEPFLEFGKTKVDGFKGRACGRRPPKIRIGRL